MNAAPPAPNGMPMRYATQIDGAQATPSPLTPNTMAEPKNQFDRMLGWAAVMSEPIRLPTLVTASSQPKRFLSPKRKSASFNNETP